MAHGATRLVLLSRSGRVSSDSQGLEQELAWLQDQPHVDVQLRRCDVSDEASVVQMLDSVRAQGAIEGIVHSAGVLRDALLRGRGAAEGVEEVWRSKARSARLLHEHTLQDELRLFLTFSSVAAAYGNAGQAAYSASNAFLDALVQERVRAGLAGASVQWPAISDMGMAATTLAASAPTGGDSFLTGGMAYPKDVTR